VSEPGAPRLSVCLPTHHGRAGTLRDALESLRPQVGPDVEVCVTDNASEDGTEALVASLAAGWPGRLAYRRHPQSLGFAGNLLSAVELARGEFCWLFSSDDAVAPGGVAAILALIDRHPGAAGFTLETTLVDAELRADVKQFGAVALPHEPAAEHVYASAEAALEQCSFISGVLPTQVVRRSLWRQAVARDGDPGARAPYFPHMRLMALVIAQHPHWVWHPGRTFLMRTGRGNSVIDDLRGDIMTYHVDTADEQIELWREVLGPRSPAARRLVRRLYRCLFTTHFVGLMKADPSHGYAEDRRLLAFCVRRFWRIPEFWVRSFPVLVAPHPLVRPVWTVGPRLKRRLLRVGVAP